MRNSVRFVSCLVLIIILLAKCSKSGDLTTNSGFSALPLSISTPPDNPQSTQKINLGRLLFWDPVLSGRKDVACGTCHHAALGYSDNLDLSIGVNGTGTGSSRHFVSPNTIPFARRNSLSIINTAFNGISPTGVCTPSTAAMFFDNRVVSLELQSMEPIKTMEEMKGTSIAAAAILDTVILRLKNIPQYAQLFSEVFSATDAVNITNLGKAIASYERSIVSNHSAFDEYERGNKSALTATQIQGMNAFVSNGCANCHSGPMFSDYALHVLSVPDNAKLPTDAGANGTYAFRTPTLRNLAITAPYMHSGVFNTLDAVWNFYDQVGDGRSQNTRVNSNKLDGKLQRLNNRDKDAIISFIGSLNDPGFDKTIPITVPSGLHPGGN